MPQDLSASRHPIGTAMPRKGATNGGIGLAVLFVLLWNSGFIGAENGLPFGGPSFRHTAERRALAVVTDPERTSERALRRIAKGQKG